MLLLKGPRGCNCWRNCFYWLEISHWYNRWWFYLCYFGLVASWEMWLWDMQLGSCWTSQSVFFFQLHLLFWMLSFSVRNQPIFFLLLFDVAFIFFKFSIFNLWFMCKSDVLHIVLVSMKLLFSSFSPKFCIEKWSHVFFGQSGISAKKEFTFSNNFNYHNIFNDDFEHFLTWWFHTERKSVSVQSGKPISQFKSGCWDVFHASFPFAGS